MRTTAIKQLIIISLCLIGIQAVMAQNSVTMTSATIYIDGCQLPNGTIYDNGGPTGNYTTNFDGIVTIIGQPGSAITLNGSYNTESNYDKITVYDGNGANGNILVDHVSGNNTLSAVSYSGYLTLAFHTDGSVTYSGFELNYSCSCPSSSTAVCDPLTRSDLPYSHGFESVATTGRVDSCWSLSGAYSTPVCPHNGQYAICANKQYFSTNIYIVLPAYADTLNETMVSFWAQSMTNTTTGNVEVGVMTDPQDGSTFTHVATVPVNDATYGYHYASLAGYSDTGHYVALRVSGSGTVLYIDDVTLQLLSHGCLNVVGLNADALTATSVALSWQTVGLNSLSATSFEITATAADNSSTLTATTTEYWHILSGLSPATAYNVVVQAQCPDDSSSNSISILTPDDCPGSSTPSGSDSYQAQGVPVRTSYSNNICQSIYSASLLRSMGMTAGDIQSMTYTWTQNTNESKVFQIYLGTTSQDTYTSAAPINESMTLVYSGNHPINTQGQQTYTFTNSFYWDGTSNLVVTTLMNQPVGLNQTYSNFYGISTSMGNYVSVYKGRDNTAFSISDLSLSSWTRSYYLPNVTFYICTPASSCQRPLVTVSDVGQTTATLRWSADNGSTSWNIAYKRHLDDTWNTVATATTAHEYVFNNLASGTSYDFRVTSICPSGSASTTVHATTPCSPCNFNYDDLYAANVTCYTGTFYSPRTTVGVVDNGSDSQSSRHTVHTNTAETDPRTGGQLRTVPEGYCSSVRLGNWATGAQAESITYTYTVDTIDYDLMLLKYAAVLQDPNHTPADQPRFTFNVTDANGNSVNACYNADFVSNANLGWHTAGTNVLWKDWTTVGIDLSPLQGQTIHITLTSYDCEQSGHYGYAYFVLDLDNKVITTNSCSSDENIFQAPSGFAYRWYNGTNPNSTLSTADTLHVYTAGNFYCDLSFVGAPNDAAHANCYFTMSAVSGERHPWARFTTTRIDTATCDFTYMRLQNRSIITRDTAHTDSIGNRCESYLWVFDDGTTSREINPRHTFTQGNHTITLYAMLAHGQCVDSTTQNLFIATSCTYIDTLDRTICAGGSLRMFDTVLTTAGTYHLDSISGTDTMWLRTLHLTVQNPTADTLDVTTCSSYTWSLSGTTYSASGLYFDTLTNALGCDSIVLLNLTVNSPSTSDTSVSVCDSFVWYGRSYTASAVDTLAGVYQNAAGCDSTLVLHLTLRHSTAATYYDTCVENLLPRTYLGLTAYGDTANAVITIPNAAGCDSVITYHLHVHWNNSSTLDSIVCDDMLPLTWNHRTFTAAGTQLDTLTNVLGSDSLITMNVQVLPTYDITLYDTICSNQTYSFDGNSYTDPGIYTDSLLTHSTPACDSVRTLLLTVKRSDDIHLYDTIYQGDTAYFEGTAYNQPGDYVFSTINAEGCDSLRTLHLVWRYIVRHIYTDSVCEGYEYPFGDTLLTETGVYRDTVFAHSYPTPDTLRVLTLVVVPMPEVSISEILSCGEEGHYTLTAHTDAPYLHWSSQPYDPALESQAGDSAVAVDPKVTTTYYVTADYRDGTLCPVYDSIVVIPLQPLTALIETFPSNLTADRRSLTAYNRSIGIVTQREWYVRYNEEEPVFYGDGNSITLDLPAYVKELNLILTVANDFCADTDTLAVPILSPGLFIPSVFTPDEETNNRFRVAAPDLTDFEIWIYDRRGDLVYHSTDPAEGWDGTHNGYKCHQAAYVYRCRYQDNTSPEGYQNKTGTVVLLR